VVFKITYLKCKKYFKKKYIKYLIFKKKLVIQTFINKLLNLLLRKIFIKYTKNLKSINKMKRSSRRWKKKRQMRWKWQRKILKRVKKKRKQRRG